MGAVYLAEHIGIGRAVALTVVRPDLPADPTAAERYADAAVWRPSAAARSAHAGNWFSPDLDADWSLEANGSRLMLRGSGQRGLTLRPSARDRLLRGFGPVGELSARLHFIAASEQLRLERATELRLPTMSMRIDHEVTSHSSHQVHSMVRMEHGERGVDAR